MGLSYGKGDSCQKTQQHALALCPHGLSAGAKPVSSVFLSHQCNGACRAGLSVSILQECLVLGASQAIMNGVPGNKAQPQTRSQPSLHGRRT